MRLTIQLLQYRGLIACMLLITSLAMSSCSTDSDDDDEQMIEYSGTFIPANDNVTTSASGTTSATLNQDTREITYDVEWQGLTTPVSNMHFHDDGPVIHGIDGWDEATSGSVSGTVTFSADEVTDLEAGDVYVMIHTQEYPGGEVIAILTVD
ncbi:MAG: CHRD domain-containing protein [Balneolales bacterium]